jgi:hypothetical protein
MTMENCLYFLETLKLKITISSKTATAVLYGNPTSRDFTSFVINIVEI